MNKKMFGILSVLAIVVLGAGFLVFNRSNAAPQPCLAKNSSLELKAKDLNDIEQAAMMADVTVPAGEYADVRIATYDGKQATGSVLFSQKYGAYNYTATKVDNADSLPDNNVTWQLAKSAPCVR